MSARTKARKRALDVLFSADVRGIGVSEALAAEAVRASAEPQRASSWSYARELVTGVLDQLETIDELIETYAHGWSLARMPAVDRALLRLGTWELLFNDEVPDGVAIAEAVDAAGALSTEDSGRFVNGVLARIAETKSPSREGR